jgi:hypothetical protein
MGKKIQGYTEERDMITEKKKKDRIEASVPVSQC